MILSELKKTSIGGQALIEGVMMRGPHISAMAVRKPDQTIHLKTWDTGGKKWYHHVPLLRGVLNFITMLVVGYRCLMESAEIAGMADAEEEPSKLEKWLADHLGNHMTLVFNIVTGVLAVIICLGLFMLLPASIVKILGTRLQAPTFVMTILEGCIKIIIFILYLFLVTRMKEIQRVFQYHGAEHKTIACYEAGEELTPENARKHTRFHPRCGTSFLLIVLVISIFVFSVLSWDNIWMRVVLKLVLLPVVVGVAYEIIKLAGRYSNPFTRMISAPGLWLQRLTTFEPDDTMLEIAIAAMKPCIPENPKDDLY